MVGQEEKEEDIHQAQEDQAEKEGEVGCVVVLQGWWFWESVEVEEGVNWKKAPTLVAICPSHFSWWDYVSSFLFFSFAFGHLLGY